MMLRIHICIFTVYQIMGGIASSIQEHKYESSLALLAMTVVGFTYYQKAQTEQLRKLTRSIDPYMPAMPKSVDWIPKELNEKILLEELLKYKQNPIYRIAITGGPCAGKSTALNKIREHFMAAGFHVMIVPEVPTIVAKGGGMNDYASFTIKERMSFQKDLMKIKIYFEDYIAKVAEMAHRPTLILCDRGLVDCAAYMSHDEYQGLLDEQSWTWSHLRDKRYDSVIFMNTAAKGAQAYYTIQNNSARTETPQQARDLDDKTLQAWIGHPYMTIVPNIGGKTFSYKVGLAIKAVQKTIGLEPTNIQYHKFLVQIDKIPSKIKVVQSQIEQIFLINKSPRYVQDRIRKRGQDQSYTYQRRYVAPRLPQSQFREVRKISLNSLQFATLAEKEADPNRKPIIFNRKNFEWNCFYFSIDSYQNLKDGVILRFSADVDLDPLEIIPPWIMVLRNIRDEEQFNMGVIAKKD